MLRLAGNDMDRYIMLHVAFPVGAILVVVGVLFGLYQLALAVFG